MILLLALVTCWLCLAGAHETPAVLLAPGPWPENLAGWEQRGPAEFVLDREVTWEKLPTVRVRVAPGAELRYQQLAWVVREDVRPNDEFTGAAWVRTEGIEPTATGAYVALEILDAGGERLVVYHNKISSANGRDGWERLWVTGTAPAGAAAVRLCLVLHAAGTAWWAQPEIVRTARIDPWPDLGNQMRTLTVDAGHTIQPSFRGVGFHAYHHIFDYTQEQLDNIIVKRWRELNPSFARLNDQNGWEQARLDSIARHLNYMKQTGTELYVATWNPIVTQPGEERRAYARSVADRLEYFIRDKGCDHIRWYCMSNELTLNGWGAMAQDLPTFGDYHQCLRDEFQARGLPVGLLATDAAPASYWWTLEWAAANMDHITDAYGGHHYFAEHNPDDERFYAWFLEKLCWAVRLAQDRGKPFILGEFGAKQDGRVVDGVRRDVCIWWDTPQEPYVALQLADAVVAAINAGVYAMGYWTFMDLPDDYVKGYINKWGTFRWSGDDFSTRDLYYGYGLLSKFLRGPARAVLVQTSDPRLHAAAIQQDGGAWSIAVVNRNRSQVPLRVELPGVELARPFRKYVYQVAAVPQHPFGDLQGPAAVLWAQDGILSDSLQPESLAVYTTAYDDDPPPAVTRVQASPQPDGTILVSWQPSSAGDLCYYRVFRGDMQIGSTVATHLLDRQPRLGEAGTYSVVAVDQSGNASRAASS